LVNILSRVESYEVCVSEKCEVADFIILVKSLYVAGRRWLHVLKLMSETASTSQKQWSEVYSRELKVYASLKELREIEEGLRRLQLPEQLVKFVLSKL